MSAQSLLHSVFSCSSPASGSPSAQGFSKRKLRQTRSLDPALIGGCGGDVGVEGGSAGAPGSRLCSPLPLAEGLGGRSASSPRGPHSRAHRLPSPRPLCASFSTPSTPLEKSPSGSFHFDYEVPLGRSGLKKSMAWDLPSVCSAGGGSGSIFASPRRWLQHRKSQCPPSSHGHPYVVWKSEVGSGAGALTLHHGHLELHHIPRARDPLRGSPGVAAPLWLATGPWEWAVPSGHTCVSCWGSLAPLGAGVELEEGMGLCPPALPAIANRRLIPSPEVDVFGNLMISC